MTLPTSWFAGAALALSLLFAQSQQAFAQALPPVLEVAGGALMFPEVSEPFVGAAARVYLSPRISIGPEIAHVRGDGHTHLLATGNITFDLVRPRMATARRFTPFVIAGGGLYQTRERFRDETFTSTEGSFTAGGGIRVRVGPRVFAGAEARVGWEPHLRVNALLGVRLGQ
jgi:hypothetical protein